MKGSEVTGPMTLEGILGHWLLLFVFLLPGYHEASSFQSPNQDLFTHYRKAVEQLTMDFISKTIIQNNLFLFI